jgi:hypothetical protein
MMGMTSMMVAMKRMWTVWTLVSSPRARTGTPMLGMLALL